jgi:capsular polysaccharide biosynthesis protein
MYLERKVHDAYAAIVNPVFPVQSLDETKLPRAAQLAEGGSEKLDVSLEERFYNRKSSVQNTIQYSPVKSFNFDQVSVVGDQGYIFQASRKMVSVCDEVNRIKLRKVRRPVPLLARKVDRPVFHLTGNNHESHGHFVLQHLPRLMAARDRLLANPEVKLLLATGHLHWQRFYLERLGFGSERLLEGTPGTLHCRGLEYIPFFHGPGNLVAAKTYREMRGLFAPAATERADRCLFLSRKGATHRALLNEAEVFQACREVWPEMEPVDLKDYSSAEQVVLFRSARVIFGPHGQAFTNMLYTRDALAVIVRPGTDVEGWSASFRNLALQVGGEALVLTAGIEGWKNKDNWTYCLKRLREQLDRLHSLLPDKYR